MFFRNLVLFHLPAEARGTLRAMIASGSLQSNLAEMPLQPVGPCELSSEGWVSPYGLGTESLLMFCWDAVLVTLGTETRQLPASAVNRELANRLAQIEASEGKAPGGRARKRLRDDIVAELLPRAFVKPGRLSAYVDLRRGFVAVDTTSTRAAERVISALRHTLGSFPALPMSSDRSVVGVLTSWLAGEPLPDLSEDESLLLGDACVLKDPTDTGATVRFTGAELIGSEMEEHLRAGKQCASLALEVREHVSFVLTDDLRLRRLRFGDAAMFPLEQMELEGAHAELDARFAIMSAELRQVYDVLQPALGLDKDAAA